MRVFNPVAHSDLEVATVLVADCSPHLLSLAILDARDAGILSLSRDRIDLVCPARKGPLSTQEYSQFQPTLTCS